MSTFCTYVANDEDRVAHTYVVKGERSCFTYLSRRRRDVFRAFVWNQFVPHREQFQLSTSM